jgi:hypothetical protein
MIVRIPRRPDTVTRKEDGLIPLQANDSTLQFLLKALHEHEGAHALFERMRKIVQYRISVDCVAITSPRVQIANYQKSQQMQNRRLLLHSEIRGQLTSLQPMCRGVWFIWTSKDHSARILSPQPIS